jgi:dTDP-4-amino-4,6-dideoxygalactose transaminase
LIPLFKPQKISSAMLNAVKKTLESGVYVKGPVLESFEEKFANYCERKFGVGVSSGTVAIYIALKALGIKAGDKIIVPSHTFVGTASPILMLGAVPVFVDIDEYFTIDYVSLKEQDLTNVKALIAVDLYGQTADNEKIERFCKQNNIAFIEDTAQAHGAELNGKKAGSFGDLSCFSFFPTKNLSVLGDGGMVLTNNLELNKKCQIFRDQGRDYSSQNGKFSSSEVSMNFRLDEIRAAMGRQNLTTLDIQNMKRIRVAKQYSKKLKTLVATPLTRQNAKHVFHQYVIRVEQEDRKNLVDKLKQNGIASGIHYPIPLHQQPIFAKYSKELPKTETVVKEIISLPMYPDLSTRQINYIVKTIESYYKS